jgi:hypothetical protein
MNTEGMEEGGERREDGWQAAGKEEEEARDGRPTGRKDHEKNAAGVDWKPRGEET